jgi:hypothetical protein
VFQNLFSLGKELLVENRVLHELGLLPLGGRHVGTVFHISELWSTKTISPELGVAAAVPIQFLRTACSGTWLPKFGAEEERRCLIRNDLLVSCVVLRRTKGLDSRIRKRPFYAGLLAGLTRSAGFNQNSIKVLLRIDINNPKLLVDIRR